MISHLKKRTGAFLHPSWLAKYFSGDRQCLWGLNRQARCYLPKSDSSFDLNAYKVKHQSLLTKAISRYEAEGYQVFVESANEYSVRTKSGVIINCCPDLIALKNDQVFVVDAKTGSPSGKDYGQVQLYMMTIPIAGIHGICSIPTGQVFYREFRLDISPDELTPEWKAQLSNLVSIAAQVDPPKPRPSKRECQWCPAAMICPHRIEESPVGHCDWL